MSSLRLFGDFGPPAFRSYIDAPPKTRWWPIVAAFGTTTVCVLAVHGLPQRRAEVSPTTHIYVVHNRSSPEYAGAVTTPTITRAEPTKFLEVQEERPLIQEDQPTISPALEIFVKPTDIAQSPAESRHSAAKTHSKPKKRHVARNSRRHERNDAYARYYDTGRYYGGYGGYWR
jgi:hypothetical protein